MPPSDMSDGKAIGVLKRATKIAHDDHVGRLLGLGGPLLDSIVPGRGIPVTSMLTTYNAEVAAELNRYGDVLVAVVISVLEKVAGSAQAPSRDAALAIVTDVLRPELYVKRFTLFAEGIARRAQSYGIPFELRDHRVDIPQGLAEVDAVNQCARIRRRVAASMDKLYLANAPDETEAVASKPLDSAAEPLQRRQESLYARLNRFHDEHPAAVWVIGLAASILLGAMLTG